MRRYPPPPSRGAVIALILFVAIVVVVLFTAADADNAARRSLPWRVGKIIEVRGHVHACQRDLGRGWSPVAERYVKGGPPYRRWVLNLWRERRTLYCGVRDDLNAHPTRAIRFVFGDYGAQALAVSSCETGGTFSVHATNGQYLGLFQMGDYARSAYGHGWTPLQQAWAAWRYFDRSGRDWSPWSCKPW